MKVIFLDFDGVINNCGDIDDYIFYPVNDKSNRIHSLPFSASNIVPLKMLFDFLFKENLENSALLLMSSGNYGGLNFDEVKGLISN